MLAFTRSIPNSFIHALSAVPPDPPIDLERARSQHAAYRATLQAFGAKVMTVDADEDSPDCCFIEDTAIVAGGIALMTRPGAPSRQAEGAPVAAALSTWVELATMSAPATLDGGDCLRLGRTLYIGRSARTNAAGIARADAVFGPRGYRVVAIDLPSHVLHLKCVCAPLGDDQMLLAEHTIAPEVFAGAGIVSVPTEETYAANAVAIGNQVVIAAGFPRTHAALEDAGFQVFPIETTEMRKADGSLTCLSILITT